MIIIKKEKIVHGIKIVKNRDFFLQDKNRFERTDNYDCRLIENNNNNMSDTGWRPTIGLHK